MLSLREFNKSSWWVHFVNFPGLSLILKPNFPTGMCSVSHSPTQLMMTLNANPMRSSFPSGRPWLVSNLEELNLPPILGVSEEDPIPSPLAIVLSNCWACPLALYCLWLTAALGPNLGSKQKHNLAHLTQLCSMNPIRQLRDLVPQ